MNALTVLFDFRSPQCYLALAPTRQMLEDINGAALWVPLLVDAPRRPPRPEAGAPRGDWHRWHRACYREMDLRRYAAARDLPAANFDEAGLHRAAAGKLAAAGYLWLGEQAPGHQVEYLSRVFEGYWNSDLSLDDPMGPGGVIEALTRDAGRFLADGASRALARLDAQQQTLRERGLFDVPGYLVADEVFYGRQHLPMVRQRMLATG